MRFFSIITVVYNGSKYIERTIKSVVEQGFEDYEYIIIDGGSNDGTNDIISKYRSRISYCISEKDNGIYDAMNKGICISNAKWVGFINAGDTYNTDTLQHVWEVINNNPLINIVHGSNEYINDDGHTLSIHRPSGNKCEAISHPSTFTKREVFDRLGLYPTKYTIAGDLYYYLIIARAEKKHYTSYILSTMLNGGVSTKFSIEKSNQFYSLYRHCGCGILASFCKSFIKPGIGIIARLVFGELTANKIRALISRSITR